MLIMNDQIQKEKKKILTLRVKQNIEGEEWQKLVNALPVAEEIGISNNLLLKSYLLLGDQYIKVKPYSDAMVYYLKATTLADDETIYLRLAGLIKRFYKLYETSFCKFDLQRLQFYLRSLTKKVALLFPGNYALLEELNFLHNDIKELELSTTNSLTESSATVHIDKIFNQFYRPKNPQEVFERSGDVLLDWIQPFYDEELKKEIEDKRRKKMRKKGIIIFYILILC